MQKVQITVRGMQALVDPDMVAPMKRKEALVNTAMTLQKLGTPEAKEELMSVMGKIIRLNRRIRQNVQFI